MSTAHAEFDELVAGHVLGALEGEDVSRFAAHLAGGCAECGRAVADYQEAFARAAADVREAPPARVRHALLQRVGEVPARGARVGRALAWAASVVLAAGLGAVGGASWVRARYEARLDQLASEAAGLRAELAAQVETVSGLRRKLDEQEKTLTLVKAQAAEQERTLTLLGDPETRLVSLAGLAPRPQAQGRIIWNARTGGLLVAADLPPPPEGKVYELWAIAGGKPLPAGLFTVDPEGKGRLTVAPLAGVTAVDVFAVTLEPAGGVQSPTGAMYLASKKA
jgi:anti-sigma-K factor RskA